MFSSFPNTLPKSPRSQHNLAPHSNLYSKSNFKFNTEHNPELFSHRGVNFDNVNDSSLQFAIDKLIKENTMLSEALQSER